MKKERRRHGGDMGQMINSYKILIGRRKEKKAFARLFSLHILLQIIKHFENLSL
jgi:hypothetical protein